MLIMLIYATLIVKFYIFDTCNEILASNNIFAENLSQFQLSKQKLIKVLQLR